MLLAIPIAVVSCSEKESRIFGKAYKRKAGTNFVNSITPALQKRHQLLFNS